jgi:ribose-phosphate pyrophosphokinase
VLSGSALHQIENSVLTELVVSNSIPLRNEARSCKRIRQLSVAPLLAKAIRSIYEETSISRLFV